MTSVMLALLLTVWALPGQVSAGDMTILEANFITMFSGNYDNIHQFQADNKSHDYMQFRSVPVTTPAFPGKTVLFGEWVYNGIALITEFCELFEIRKGLIQISLYNVTGLTKERRGFYNLDDLSKLNPEAVQRPSKCQADFEPVGSRMFIGSWPSCKHRINGKPTLYTDIATCNSLTIVIPTSATEQSSPVPYNFERKGDRYTIPGTPDGWTSPCEKST